MIRARVGAGYAAKSALNICKFHGFQPVIMPFYISRMHGAQSVHRRASLLLTLSQVWCSLTLLVALGFDFVLTVLLVELLTAQINWLAST